ncbi:hypothetical protein HZA42_01240 [Candidatus Peregrinibacteria bacterium]|nr:hypothetical protein [Candidatus Peregrinibacteria bacterium]
MSEHPSFEPRAEIDTVTHKLTEWATIVNTKIQEQEDKKNRCKEEYENLFPVVKAILRKRGWSEHKIIDTFDILYRRLFFEPDYKQIQDDFELNDSQVHWYRKVAVRILRELANNQLITLSDELNELLSSPNLQKKQEKLSSESLKNILIELI